MTREELRQHLDRKPPTTANWRFWFWAASDEYLGERSARTGPDVVGAEHSCGCHQCRGTVAT